MKFEDKFKDWEFDQWGSCWKIDKEQETPNYFSNFRIFPSYDFEYSSSYQLYMGYKAYEAFNLVFGEVIYKFNSIEDAQNKVDLLLDKLSKLKAFI